MLTIEQRLYERTVESIDQYLVPSDYKIQLMKNPFHSSLIVGGMGSGKTTYMLSMMTRAYNILRKRGYTDDEVKIVHTEGYSVSMLLLDLKRALDLEKIKFLYIFNDDAPSSKQSSRQRLKIESIANILNVFRIRHHLEEMGYNGFIFIAFATQTYTALDPDLRRACRLKIFKDYPDEPADKKLIGLMLGRSYMNALREITLSLIAPKSKEDLIRGLQTAVCKLGLYKLVAIQEAKQPPQEAYIHLVNQEIFKIKEKKGKR